MPTQSKCRGITPEPSQATLDHTHHTNWYTVHTRAFIASSWGTAKACVVSSFLLPAASGVIKL